MKFSLYDSDSLLVLLILLLATLMWSLSVVGIWSNFNNISIAFCFSFSIILSTSWAFLTRNQRLYFFDVVDVVGMSILVLLPIFYVVFIPPFTYDEVAYSVALPRDYAFARHYFYNADYGPYSAFPQNYEIITTLSILLFKSPVLAKIINFLMAISLAPAASLISIYMGVKKRISLMAALLVLFSTAFITAVPIAKNDIANSFFQVWALVMLIVYFNNKSLSITGLIAIFIGTAIGTKYNSLVFSVVPVSAFFLLTYYSNLLTKDKFTRYVFFTLILVITAFPWYLSNWLKFGNPFYPVANGFFNSLSAFNSNYSTMFHEMFYNDIVNFSWENGTIIGFLTNYTNGFGRVVCIIGIIGLLSSLIKYDSKLQQFIAIIFLALIVTTLRFGFWEPRYSLVLLVLFASMSALTIQHLANHELFDTSNVKRLFNIILIIIFLASINKCIKIYGFIEYNFEIRSGKSFSEHYIPGWKVANFLNKNTKIGSRIAVGIGSNQMFYYLDRPYYHIHPLTEKSNLLSIQNGEDFYKLLKNLNVNYLAISDWRFRTGKVKTPNMNDFCKRLNSSIDSLVKINKLLPVTTIDDVIIYKLGD